MDATHDQMTVGFISLGCAKNLVDTEHMAAVLRRDGIGLAPSPDEADVLLVNTCGFIGDAKRESIDAILRACAHKAAGHCRAVIVAGCLAQRYRRALARAMPEVDAFLGIAALDRVRDIVGDVLRGEIRPRDTPPNPARVLDPPAGRPILTGGPFAYLKIADGCNHRCAFCAIPAIRGRFRSRSIAAIVREADDLLGRGIRELNLVAQDATAFGRDRAEHDGLARLLRALGRLGGRFWIRILYGHPGAATDELLDTMGEVRQVCRYLDVPVQHSHPDILRAMRRAGTIMAVNELPRRIRARLPGVVLRTTCIAGFPGERPAHFNHLRDYLRRAAFDHLGVFTYSAEEGTAAAAMPHGVSAVVARRRRGILMRDQQVAVRRMGAGMVGSQAEVLVERSDGAGRWICRTRGQAPEVDGVIFLKDDAETMRPGRFLHVKIIAAAGYDLIAVPA